MKPFIKTLSLALSMPLALAGNASAVTALRDFGISNTPTYNSVSMLTAPDTGVVPLFDTMMASTGWSARVLEAGGGVIEILIGSPGPDNLGALALNFGSITEVVPEPSALLLLGVSGLGLLARRRR